MLLRTFLAFAMAAIVWPVSAASLCAQSESEAATMLYRKYRDFVFSGAPQPLFEAKLSGLVQATIKQTQERNDVGPIDWDFWTDAQDGEATSYMKIQSVQKKREDSVVEIRYAFLLSPTAVPTPKVAFVHLARNPSGCWQVIDLVRNNKSVRSILAKSLAETAARK
jgi:hypothetical protein